MKIISLEAQNVKKLKLVRIEPDGSTVIIGGKNAQGKSSVLDCIIVALGGTKFAPKQAVRKGEEKGHIVLDLGEYTIKRTFTESGGGAVYVENKDGARFQSPQSMLDGLLSSISFDPLWFAKLGDQGSAGLAKQLEILKQVSGVDTSKLDDESAKLYEERADLNRGLKIDKVNLESRVYDETAPAEVVSVVDLTKELEEARTTNEENERQRVKITTTEEGVSGCQDVMDLLDEEIKELQKRIDTELDKKITLQKTIDDNKDRVDALEDTDLEPIRVKINNSETDNLKVSGNKSYLELKATVEKNDKLATKKTIRMEAIKVERKALVGKSNLPVKDLVFDETGVNLNDLPFSQASSAEQLKVSVALGLAMNPKLKVLLIKDGSLLDEDNLAMISRMAEKAGGQIWIERVGLGKEMTVILEDGEIIKPTNKDKKK